MWIRCSKKGAYFIDKPMFMPVISFVGNLLKNDAGAGIYEQKVPNVQEMG